MVDAVFHVRVGLPKSVITVVYPSIAGAHLSEKLFTLFRTETRCEVICHVAGGFYAFDARIAMLDLPMTPGLRARVIFEGTPIVWPEPAPETNNLASLVREVS